MINLRRSISNVQKPFLPCISQCRPDRAQPLNQPITGGLGSVIRDEVPSYADSENTKEALSFPLMNMDDGCSRSTAQ